MQRLVASAIISFALAGCGTEAPKVNLAPDCPCPSGVCKCATLKKCGCGMHCCCIKCPGR
jgi:hypothetical protein